MAHHSSKMVQLVAAGAIARRCRGRTTWRLDLLVHTARRTRPSRLNVSKQLGVFGLLAQYLVLCLQRIRNSANSRLMLQSDHGLHPILVPAQTPLQTSGAFRGRSVMQIHSFISFRCPVTSNVRARRRPLA